ncbi:helix-turn-helix domain-containing protein, partial [Desulfogranum mediterraneum]|uniref:helix-turn-helix domain-containing protein n=2 Tax=Desulfogranum mediterraneum TaxID=160661 RepID=UPI0012947159
MSYQHLSLAERHYIEMSRKKGVSRNQIAKDLGRSQSTISREILRNTGLRGYRHKQANRFTVDRHATKPKSVKLTDE